MGRLKGSKQSEESKKKISEGMKKVRATQEWPVLLGKENPAYKHGKCADPKSLSKMKNKRNNTRLEIRREFGGHSVQEWETLKAQYNWTCPSCGKREPEIKLTEDHIIPFSKGGSDNIENVQPLCAPCNGKKYTKIIRYNHPLS